MSNPNPSALSRRALLGAAAATALTGCYGSFNLTGLVYDWNGSFSSKWVRWLVFLGLVLIPVYAVLLVVDALILNTIEFFSGEHPVSRATLEDGSTVVAEKTDDPKVTRLKHERDGKTLTTLYCERPSDDEMILRDSKMNVLSRVHRTAEGVELSDARGRRIALLDGSSCRALCRDLEGADSRAHRSPSAVLEARLAESGASRRVAALRRDLAARGVL